MIGREIGDQLNTGWALLPMGTIAYQQDDYPAAQPLLEAGLASCRAAGVAGRRGVGWGLIFLVELALQAGDQQKARTRTTSPNPVLRFLLMGLALLIVNMWIRLHWLFLRIPGRGPGRVAHVAFRLDRMVRFLTRAIERFYGVVSEVEPPLASMTAVGLPRP